MANSTCPDFNLADDPWILVVMRDGSTCEVSIREAFRQAPRISRLTGDIPQQHVLVLRLLESILYRAYYFAYPSVKTHPEMLDLWEEIWTEGSFDDAVIDSYLDKYYERFSLFGDTPFMQVSGLEYLSKGKVCDPASEMILDVPKPDKYLFSTRRSARSCSLTYSEAARWLLCVQGYDCAGIKSPVVGNSRVKGGRVYAPKGLPSVGWLGSIGTVFIEGKSLFETLLLNFVMYTEGVGSGDLFGIVEDVPSWESPLTPFDDALYAPAGPASLFAVNSRRARLVLDDEGTSVAGFISCYGDIVRPEETSGCETMTAWKEGSNQQKRLGLASPPLMPREHDCSESLWRGLRPLLARSSEPGSPDLRAGVIRWVDLLEDEEIEGLPDVLKVHAQGIKYGTQSSFIENTYDDVLDLGDAMLHIDGVAFRYAIDTVAQIKGAVSCLAKLVKELRRLAGSRGNKKGKGKREGEPSDEQVANHMCERAYFELDSVARRYLRGFSSDRVPSEYCREWRSESKSVLLRLGQSYISGASSSRFAYERDGKEGQSVAGAWNRFIYWMGKELDLDEIEIHEEAEG